MLLFTSFLEIEALSSAQHKNLRCNLSHCGNFCAALAIIFHSNRRGWVGKRERKNEIAGNNETIDKSLFKLEKRFTCAKSALLLNFTGEAIVSALPSRSDNDAINIVKSAVAV